MCQNLQSASNIPSVSFVCVRGSCKIVGTTCAVQLPGYFQVFFAKSSQYVIMYLKAVSYLNFPHLS